MAYIERYANFDLTTGLDDGTSEANAWQTPASMVAGYAAGDRINIKRTATRYASSQITLSTSAGVASPIHFRGYETTIGDGGVFQGSARWFCPGEGLLLEGLDIEADSGQSACSLRDGSHATRCRIINTRAQGEGLSLQDASASFCYVRAGGSLAVSAVQLDRGFISNSVIEGNGATCVDIEASFRDNSVFACVILSHGTAPGIVVSGSNGRNLTIENNAIYNFTDAIRIDNGMSNGESATRTITGNILYQGSNGVVNNDATSTYGVTFVRNAMGGLSGSRLSGWIDLEEIDPITLTADPFTDAPSGDLSTNDTPGGGALLKSSGYDAESGLTTFYPFNWLTDAAGGGGISRQLLDTVAGLSGLQARSTP